MNSLFEYSDRLNAPYECFLFDTRLHAFPIRSHWHYFVEILYIVEGTALITCDNSSYTLKPGDMIIFPPQAIHAIYYAEEKPLAYYVMKFDINLLAPSASSLCTVFSGINFASLFRLAKGDPNASFLLTKDILHPYPIDTLFADCLKEMRKQEYGSRILLQSNISTLLTYVLRIWRANGFNTDKSLALPREESSIHSITEYIDAHAHEPLKVEQLAERCHMSYSYFAKSFRELYGQSCKKYIEFIRLSKAEDLLLFTNLDLNYIAQETGFSDCSHFIKAFRSKHNITPKQFRREHSN